jgi:hypothetical protein
MLLRAAVLVLLVAPPVLADELSPAQISAMVEKHVREVLIPAGYPAAAERSKMSGAKTPAQAIDALIAETEAAPIVSRREARKPREPDQLTFRNKREKDLRLLELQIRKQLIPSVSGAWEEPSPSHFKFSTLQDGTIAVIGSAAADGSLEFEQRADETTVHAYAETYTAKRQRYAIHGLPRPVADTLETGRPTKFTVLISGTDRYESVTGERTVVALYYVPDDLVPSLYAKLVPAKDRIATTSAKTAPVRTWTSSDGKYTVEGYAHSATNAKVTLIKADGSSIDVPLAKLSREDADWVKAFIEAQKPLELGGPSDAYEFGGYGP